MYYKDLCGENVSILGFGAMRLPTLENGSIDESAAKEMVDYAFEQGVNYFDTAYLYHGGASEKFLGKALADKERESYYLASKFPGFAMGDKSVDEIFSDQLERCKVDYFDFYMLHNVNERSINTYLDEDKAIIKNLLQKKEEGIIRHLGFSSHGKPEMLRQFCDVASWDFVQLEMNYLDWTLQDAKQQYEIVIGHGLPVIVMEPIRGGRLASLTDEADEVLLAAEPHRSIASWALRWLMQFDSVKLVLSGMSSMDQVRDNLKTYEHENPLNNDQLVILEKATEMLKGAVNVPCTECAYCTEDCPQGLDIPNLINIYNNYTLFPNIAIRQAMGRLSADQHPNNCISCGVCVDHCPQAIDIPEVLEKFDGVMDQAISH